MSRLTILITRWTAVCILAGLGLTACSSYNPLRDDADLRREIGTGPPSPGAVQVTYFGNTTLLIRDGTTTLLVDGFFSRPGFLQTFFGNIGPRGDVDAKLRSIGVNHIDAILVGHAHHDHALDATELADRYETQVIGSASFAQIYGGSHRAGRNSTLVRVPADGTPFETPHENGAFKVRFVRSEHIRSFSFIQRMIEGHIEQPLHLPARFSRFKCGHVYALHIYHPQGSILVTTTAGAAPGALQPSQHNANVAFLSTGFLSKETPAGRQTYWQETIEATQENDSANVVVPVHWDNFTRKLSDGLQPPPSFVDRAKPVMDFIKSKAERRRVRVLDVGESIWISDGQVYCPPPGT
jgi:L-ascorbate metabolism protein UlaG (beta-lactamase superfamily)